MILCKKYNFYLNTIKLVQTAVNAQIIFLNLLELINENEFLKFISSIILFSLNLFSKA